MSSSSSAPIAAHNTRSAKAACALYAERVRAIPGALQAELERPWSPSLPSFAELAAAGCLVVCGAGGSEGPARLLAELFCLCLGLPAVYRPPSAFAQHDPTVGAVIMVSQHRSPHADRVLSHAGAALRVLICAETEVLPSELASLRHGPARREDGLLPRVLGPELASFAVLRWVAALAEDAGRKLDWSRSLSEVPAAVAESMARAERLSHTVLARRELVLVASAAIGSSASVGLAGRLSESLLRAHVPVFDVCSFAHGPFQGLHELEAGVVTLELAGEGALFQRLMRVLTPERHLVQRLEASLPAPLCWLELGAGLAVLAAASLRETPRELADWPGKGLDVPLYDLDSP